MASAFELLHRSIQQALWDMRWSELRPLQTRAIRSVTQTENDLLLAASTASGKTEAAFLPILSALAASPKKSVQSLYVGPLKALINDQFGRLEELCVHAGIPVHKWHGDVSSSRKQSFRKHPGGVLLITPESLESCFINYGNQVSRIFRHLGFAVIDEVHSFLGEPRGAHLRSLLHRLEQAIGSGFRHVGLSATLGDLTQAQRYLDRQNPEAVTVIQDNGRERSVRVGIRAYPWAATREETDGENKERMARDATEAARQILSISEAPVPLRDGKNNLDLPSFGSGGDSSEFSSEYHLARDLAGVFRTKANLVFTNSRNLGEVLGDHLNQLSAHEGWPRNPFVLHHGSLSKDVRTDVEKRLRSGEPLTVLCTSTLEMGIDIGSVYSVGQLGPPWSVASLVQRLGRSGRKEDEAAILRLYSLDEPPTSNSSLDDLLCPQLLRCVALVDLMIDGWLEPVDENDLQLSTLVQQILSVLRETGGLEASEIYERLCARGHFHPVSPELFAEVLRSLGSHDLIEQMGGGDLILAPEGEHVTHRRDFYASFIGSDDYIVRTKGREIGKLPATSVPPEGEHLILNGRRWKVEVIDHRAHSVEVVPSKARKKPFFTGDARDIHPAIARRMKEAIEGDRQYPMLHRDAQELLEAARKLYQSCGLGQHAVIMRPGSCQVFPWTGSRGMRTLRLCALADGIAVRQGSLSLTYRCNEEDLLAHLRRVERKEFDAVSLASLIQDKTLDKYDGYLPDAVLDRMNAKRQVSVRDATETCRRLLRAGVFRTEAESRYPR